jgi:hypothetical protein
MLGCPESFLVNGKRLRFGPGASTHTNPSVVTIGDTRGRPSKPIDAGKLGKRRRCRRYSRCACRCTPSGHSSSASNRREGSGCEGRSHRPVSRR